MTTQTATQRPISVTGYWHETADARLYELSEPFRDILKYVVVSSIPEGDGFPAETCAFGADETGESVTGPWAILSLPGEGHHSEILGHLGYEVAK